MFKKIARLIKTYSSDSKNRQEKWNRIVGREGVDDMIGLSHKRPQVLFKHSPRCSVSSLAYGEIDQLAEWIEEHDRKVDIHMVDVVNNKSISNYVSERADLKHKSPQILLWVDGEVTYHTSHMGIKAERLIDKMG